VERILAASAQVMSESGYDRASVEEIARRADSSVGSIYQFFPDKASLFQALAESHLEDARAWFDAMLAPEARGRSPEDLIDGLVAGVWAHAREDAAMRAVWQAHLSPDLIRESDRLDTEMAGRLAAVLGPLGAAVNGDRLKVISRTAIGIVGTMLLLALRLPRVEADAHIEETRLALRRYLGPLFVNRSS
jgi:AcrR family transcriptional regulator